MTGVLFHGHGMENALDFFVHAEDAPRAALLLEEAGFLPVHGSLEAGDLFLRRGGDGLLLNLTPILPAPPRTLGELAGIRWPPELLEPFAVDGILTLTPAMQLEMKRVVSAFLGVPLREKDRLDEAALSALLPGSPLS